MKIEQIIEKALDATPKSITESFNVANEFGKVSTFYDNLCRSNLQEFNREYKKLLNGIDAEHDNKKKIELVKKFEALVKKDLDYLTEKVMYHVRDVTAHIP